MPTRKYHHKSTTGCAECKSARVKCDENKPECTRCARQGRSCSYVRQNTVPSPASSSGCAQSNPDDSVSISVYKEDLELMHHFSTHAYISLSQEESLRPIWQHTAVKQALKFPFLLRAIFSLSALHLSHTLPPLSQQYRESSSASGTAPSPSHSTSTAATNTSTPTSSFPPPTNPSNPKDPATDIRTPARLRWYDRSVADYGLALNLARPELENINEKNCHAALLFSSLIAIIRLAMPQVTGDYGPEGVLGHTLETFHLLRGKAAISDAARSWVLRGPLRSALADRREAAPREIPPAILDVLQKFEALAQSDFEAAMVKTEDDSSQPSQSEARERLGAYQFAIAGTRAYFACQPGEAAAIRIATAWPIRLPAPFMDDLRAHRPLALAILAYYAVMLDGQREHWWMADTGKHLLLQIASILGGSWAGALAPAREQMELEIDYWAQIMSLRLFDQGEEGQPFMGFVNSSDSPQGGGNVATSASMSGMETEMQGSRQGTMSVPPTPSYGSTSPYREIEEDDDEDDGDGEPVVQESPFGVSLPTGELPGQGYGHSYRT